MKVKERIKTYINGFDRELDGGIPKGHVVLIAGSAGTMKSSVAYSILYNNAVNNGVNGLYISLEQGRENLLTHMGSLGMDAALVTEHVSVIDVGLLRKKMSFESGKIWTDVFKLFTKKLKKSFDYQLLVLDSLDALELLARFKDYRTEFFKLFRLLKELKVTTFLITEIPQTIPFHLVGLDELSVFTKHKESYIADGIIHLRMEKMGKFNVQRQVRCVKMRGTKHSTGYFALMFEQGKFVVTETL